MNEILTSAACAVLLASPSAGQQEGFRWPGGARAAVCLTYDDGVDVHLDHAAPDLEAAGLRGTFYVPGSSRSLYQRLEEWRALDRRGHELGNHSIFHPCLSVSPSGERREWLAPERELERYTVPQMASELRAMNTLLYAVDGRTERTYAYTCSDLVAGGKPYLDEVRPLFLAARSGGTKTIPALRTLDVHVVPSWAVLMAPAEEMIAYVQDAVNAGSLAVFMFHGVGGGHNLDVGREDHRKLLAWLSANKNLVWTDTFRNVTTHVIAEKRRLGWAPPQRR